jgi:hypothetical protein
MASAERFCGVDLQNGDEAMQAATMTRDLVMAETVNVTVADVRLWARRIALGALIVAGVAATFYILGHMGTLVVYGLPAPFLRRVPVRVAEAA